METLGLRSHGHETSSGDAVVVLPILRPTHTSASAVVVHPANVAATPGGGADLKDQPLGVSTASRPPSPQDLDQEVWGGALQPSPTQPPHADDERMWQQLGAKPAKDKRPRITYQVGAGQPVGGGTSSALRPPILAHALPTLPPHPPRSLWPTLAPYFSAGWRSPEAFPRSRQPWWQASERLFPVPRAGECGEDHGGHGGRRQGSRLP